MFSLYANARIVNDALRRVCRRLCCANDTDFTFLKPAGYSNAPYICTDQKEFAIFLVLPSRTLEILYLLLENTCSTELGNTGSSDSIGRYAAAYTLVR